MTREEVPIKIAQAITESLKLLDEGDSLTTEDAAIRGCNKVGLEQRMFVPINMLITKCRPEAIEWAEEVL